MTCTCVGQTNSNSTTCDFIVRGTEVKQAGKFTEIGVITELEATTDLSDKKFLDWDGRNILVLHTPGHETNRSDISLIDVDNGYILTGDIYYTATLYANNMWDSVWEYETTMELMEAACQEYGVQWIYPAHNFPVKKAGIFENIFGDIAEVSRYILEGIVDQHPKYIEFRDNSGSPGPAPSYAPAANATQRVFYFGDKTATPENEYHGDYYATREWLLFRVNPRQFTGFSVPVSLAEVVAE